MNRLRMAVIGVGYLGQSHARILSGLSDIDLVGVVDVNAQQAQEVADRVGTKAYTDYKALLKRVDAVSIVTPTIYHHGVAKFFLKNRIPVLVEKPIAATVA